MANSQYYYSQTQAKEFAALNRNGGRLIHQLSKMGGLRKTIQYHTKAYYAGKPFTQSVPYGIKPDSKYTDWVLVGWGPIDKYRQTDELY